MAKGTRRITTLLITLVSLYLFGLVIAPWLEPILNIDFGFDFKSSAVQYILITLITSQIADIVYKHSKK